MNKSRTTRGILLALVVAGLGYYGWQHFHGKNQETAANRAQKAARSAVRVNVATVEKVNFPVYLTGLGTVQAFNTVLVRSRVDGQIDKIAFTEGQLVKQGDLLTEIDPRPYRAALDQAKAKKEQDEANLANTNLDLQRFIKLGEFATRQQLDTQRSSVSQHDGADRSRRRRHLQRADPARLYPDQRTDLGRRRLAPGRRRQHRQLQPPRPGSSRSRRSSRLRSSSPRRKTSCRTSRMPRALHRLKPSR